MRAVASALHPAMFQGGLRRMQCEIWCGTEFLAPASGSHPVTSYRLQAITGSRSDPAGEARCIARERHRDCRTRTRRRRCSGTTSGWPENSLGITSASEALSSCASAENCSLAASLTLQYMNSRSATWAMTRAYSPSFHGTRASLHPAPKGGNEAPLFGGGGGGGGTGDGLELPACKLRR